MRDAPSVRHQIGGLATEDRADAVIAALAAGQHGVVCRTQLLAAGVSRRQIERRLERKLLHPIHRGVYAVGHPALSQESIWMAAVLAGGEGAVLSHWSAASVLRLRAARGPRSHVTSARRRRRCRAVTWHECVLPPDETTSENAIPVTTPARTVLDLAPFLPSHSLARMVEAVGIRSGPSVQELIDRYPRRPGVPKLRAILAAPIPITRSDLEALWLERIDHAGLPRPAVNSVIEGYEVDLAWSAQRVIAEVDTYLTHGSRDSFERDRLRDRKLMAAGWCVVRLTDQEPDEALADLSRLLAASAAG